MTDRYVLTSLLVDDQQVVCHGVYTTLVCARDAIVVLKRNVVNGMNLGTYEIVNETDNQVVVYRYYPGVFGSYRRAYIIIDLATVACQNVTRHVTIGGLCTPFEL